MNDIKYLLIEGTDMSGKTTTVKNFTDSHSDAWRVRHNSLLDNPNPLGILVDQMVDRGEYEYSKTAINLAYAASALMDIDMFEWPTENTIQESAGIIRSIGYAHVNRDTGIENVLMRALDVFPNFDCSFYLTADLGSRLSRLASRAIQSSNDKLIIKDPDTFFAIDDVAKNIAIDRFGAKIIDTTALSQEDVLEIICQEATRPDPVQYA